MKPKVSIIMPVYNGEKTIARAIDYCLNQTYENFELIIVNNCSTDRTEEIIKGYKDRRVIYIYSNEKGRSKARNIALNYAKGEYLQLLDADDGLLPNKLEESVYFLENNKEYSAYCHGVYYVKNNMEILKTYFASYHFAQELLIHNVFAIESLTYRNIKSVYFLEEIDYCEDWVYWVRVLEGEKVYFDQESVGGLSFVHEDNTMRNQSIMSEYELYFLLLFKKEYSYSSISLKKHEIKRLIIHYFNPNKETITVDSIKENTQYLYLLITLICKVPGLGRVLGKKVKEIRENNLYQ